MTAAELHLVLNHFPVVGIVIATALLATALLRKSDELAKVTLVLMMILSILTIPVYMSGEPAEEIVKHMAGTSESAIHEHEDAAQFALVGAVILGIFAFFLLMRRNYSSRMITAILVVAIVVCAIMGRTAYLGGQIRHPEINW